jgi:crotonobetainyl-CoA:carnitine CoA-transferase CaiB-like acyl-CoA transferase
MAAIRDRLHEGLRHFSVQLQKPEPKQMLIAELSTLWVILENARPERMKGYGVEFAPHDKAQWENLIQTLVHETELIRSTVLKGRKKL